MIHVNYNNYGVFIMSYKCALLILVGSQLLYTVNASQMSQYESEGFKLTRSQSTLLASWPTQPESIGCTPSDTLEQTLTKSSGSAQTDKAHHVSPHNATKATESND